MASADLGGFFNLLADDLADLLRVSDGNQVSCSRNYVVRVRQTNREDQIAAAVDLTDGDSGDGF